MRDQAGGLVPIHGLLIAEGNESQADAFERAPQVVQLGARVLLLLGEVVDAVHVHGPAARPARAHLTTTTTIRVGMVMNVLMMTMIMMMKMVTTILVMVMVVALVLVMAVSR